MGVEWQEHEVAEAEVFFRSVQQRLWDAFRSIDPQLELDRETWSRPGGGGGTLGVLRGPVVEKSGAHFSKVFGDAYPSTESEYAGKPFMACGVSTITHMHNPHAPIGHMNVRLLHVRGGAAWFGGGADLTPFIRYPDDREFFHDALRDACRRHADSDAYSRYAQWCDEYFYIKHRQEIRGIGGIFFDYLQGPFAHLFPFVQAVAEAYLETYPAILRRRIDTSFTPESKQEQLRWRGRYAEFNLIYDRGTRFGLETGGNLKAIFASLPPVVCW